MEALRNAGLFALLSLLIDLVPLVMALVYVVRPTERNLSLIRPFSLAGLFSALAGGVLGFLNVLVGFGTRGESTIQSYRVMAVGAAESLVPMFLGFACLSVAWLLVAVGMTRNRLES